MSPTDPSKPRANSGVTEVTQRWEAPECPFVIDYSAAVLQQIRQRAEEAFYSLPHGGLEIGGVLFGRVSPNARSPLKVEIVAERPIECKHADGPWMVLSEDEKADVGILLDRSRVDPELSAFSVAGFWVAHGRSDLALTKDDRELYESLFPNPWQVALVLRPQMAGPTRGVFFFRVEGAIAPTAPGHAFVVGSLPEAPSSPVEAPPEPQLPPTNQKYKPIPKKRRGQVAAEEMAPAERGAGDEVPSAPSQPKPFWNLRRVVLVLLMLLAAETGAGIAALILRKPAPDLALEVFTAGPELLVHWNPQSPEIERAQYGELIFAEKDSTLQAPLNGDLIHRGFLRYHPSSDRVRVTMRITDKSGHVIETTAVQR